MKVNRKTVGTKVSFSIVIALITLACVTFAKAGEDEAIAAYNKGDYKTAYKKLLPLAEQGIANAQNQLGVMYNNGKGVSQDNVKAIFWFRKAAEQGNIVAQYNLGLMYANGQGITQDYVQALAWYRRAAEQGEADAQYNLGILYFMGEGTPKDYGQSIQWLYKAAEQGVPEAQHFLGYMYGNGNGVEKDDAQAAIWYRKAAEQGVRGAQNVLGFMYYAGEGVPKDYTQAAMWYRKAAEQGEPAAQNSLGALYYKGQGVPQDYGLARVWFSKAATQGDVDAQNNLTSLSFIPPRASSRESVTNKMDAAKQDWEAGRRLPGLPNLEKPVYVVPDSLICRSPSALGNPNVPVLLMTGACIASPKKIRVTVFPPRDAEEYLNDHMFNMVAVAWRSSEISNGNFFSGWVRIDALKN